ncbi:winged helix-turn-helix domain-containing protein [Pseudomonas sp. W2-17]|uniref:winged helix-turn-helix domain-containing protein n=1 Tax=Pseudomonas sp. W2-17 TaxID=3058039 RepID=UPI0034E06693
MVNDKIFTAAEPIFDKRLSRIAQRLKRRVLTMLVVEDLVLDTSKYRATRAQRSLKLNPTNIDILALLMLKSPGIVSKEEIAEMLWGQLGVNKSSGVGTRVHQIRKVVDDGFAFPLLHTVYGVGYQLRK